MDIGNNKIQKYLDKFQISEEQKLFISCYSFKRMKFHEIELELKKLDPSKNYADVQRLNIECAYYVEKIQKIRNKFTEKRKSDNDDFETFLIWFTNEEVNSCCGYCGISQEELYKVFLEDRLLPLNDKTKRSSGSLEIERRDSKDNSYNIGNLILACPLCNNAKSNLIDENTWREFFVPSMRKYYENLLNCKLNNEAPKA